MTPKDIGFYETGDPLMWQRGKYRIWFEGYAYVFYQVHREEEIPLAETRDLKDFKILLDILLNRVETWET